MAAKNFSRAGKFSWCTYSDLLPNDRYFSWYCLSTCLIFFLLAVHVVEVEARGMPVVI